MSRVALILRRLALSRFLLQHNMQEQFWDAIKRDRIAWFGEMHPEMAVINSVFCHVGLLPRGLDTVRDVTMLGSLMDKMGSWSLWWAMTEQDRYRYQGDIESPKVRRHYLDK